MIAPTHIVIAHASFYTMSIFTGHQPTFFEMLLVTFFAVFPADLDTPQSIIGRAFKIPATFIEYHFGHRTITHSLIAQVLIGTPLYFIAPTGIFLAIITSWISHTWADMATAQGIQYFYPSKVHCVIPENPKFRFKIMGIGELILTWLVAFMVLPLHSLATQSEGTRDIIQSTVGKIEWTRETYDKEKGAHRFYLDIKGTNNLTLDRIDGSYQIIAGYQSDGFILLNSEGEKVTTCKSTSCDWFTTKAVLRRGQAETTTTRQLKFTWIQSNEIIEDLLSISHLGQIFLIGTAKTTNGTTKTLKLEYDSIESIPRDTTLIDGDIYFQVRHEPNIPIPEIQLNDSDSHIKINPLLRKWLNFKQF